MKLPLSDFAARIDADVMILRVGEFVVRVPLYISASGILRVTSVDLESLGFDDHDKARDFVQLVCSRVVSALMPDDVREQLLRAAQRL
jgi:hypothetical protein